MNQDDFVKGKRLIDPVTGRTEGDDEDRSEDDQHMSDGDQNDQGSAFEALSRTSTQSKRMKIDHRSVDEMINSSKSGLVQANIATDRSPSPQMSGIEQQY